MRLKELFKKSFWKVIGTSLILLAIFAIIQRFATGLGNTTNLSDSFPWGLWIGFDVMVGVGLAAGGFAVASTVYVFKVERFRPILRPSILTAFLGYILVIVGLLCDLGKPWNIWHAMVYWNPHSVMFEVAWCVMLYTTVLFLEFLPVVLEKYNLLMPLKIMKKLTMLFVIVGVVLSTLHQSSLGSLFLVMPARMHPLWYSNIIPFLFFISCVAAGLAMTVIESFYSSRAFHKEIEMSLLSELATWMVLVLGLYFIVRIQDLMSRDALQYAFDMTYQSKMFLLEIGMGVVLPFILLVHRKIRESKIGLFYSSILVVLGFIAHRINTATTAFEFMGKSYTPSWQEFAVTAGLVATGFVAFSYIAKNFNIFNSNGESHATNH